MKQFFSSIRGRLLLSHLAAVLVGVLAIVFTTEPLTHRFFNAHVLDMGMQGDMMIESTQLMMGDLQVSLVDSFRSAIVVALGISAITAIGVSIYASRRLANPIEQISRVARNLARGEYHERVIVRGETELSTLARDVNTLAASLESTEQRRIELINEVAHELRTPLTTIEGYMEGLLDGVFEPTDEVFGATAREAARLKRLASDLSELSRIEESAVELRSETIDLASIAADAAEQLRPLFIEKDIALSIDVTNRLPVVGDEDRLTQVFVNILGNAITYTQPGGAVTVKTNLRGSVATVTVTDNGKGLVAEDLERIFDRFQRVDRDLPGGTGIGLTVARSLIRRHGGEIIARSDGPGSGSRFAVTLPLAT